MRSASQNESSDTFLYALSFRYIDRKYKGKFNSQIRSLYAYWLSICCNKSEFQLAFLTKDPQQMGNMRITRRKHPPLLYPRLTDSGSNGDFEQTKSGI